MAAFVVKQFGANVELRYRDVPLFSGEKARAVITDLARLHISLALQSIAGFVSDAAPVGVSGQLAQSFAGGGLGGQEVRGQTFEHMYGRVFSSLPYALVLDQGRRPGARMPPAEALELWVERKLGIPLADVPGVAFLIARSIARKGITARHYVDEGLRNATPTIDGIAASLGQAITAALVSESAAG